MNAPKAHDHCAHVAAAYDHADHLLWVASRLRAAIARAAAEGDANAQAAADELRAEPDLAAAAARAARDDLSPADQIFAASLTAMGWDADAL